MSEPERKSSSQRSGELSDGPLATVTPETHRAIEARLRISGPRNIPESIPFNGLLTNTVLASLPESEFEELLPYLEPVSCSNFCWATSVPACHNSRRKPSAMDVIEYLNAYAPGC